MIKIIAFCGKFNEIGYGDNLLESFDEDMEFFKKTTINNIVVMGGKTFESMNYKPLKNRINVVITSNPEKYKQKTDNKYPVIYSSDISIIETLNKNNDIFIIGGGQIYQQTIYYADEILIVRADKEYKQADTFFPQISESVFFKEFDRKIFGNDLLTLETYKKRSNIRLSYDD